MNCPICHHDESAVIRTGPAGETIRRRRECCRCRHRWNAWEVSEHDLARLEKLRAAVRALYAEFATIEPPAIIAQAIPWFQGSAVYFLINNGEIVYVGKTLNLAQRIGQHIAMGKQFTHVSYIECSPERLDDVERRYIQLIKPQHNKVGVV